MICKLWQENGTLPMIVEMLVKVKETKSCNLVITMMLTF